MTNRDTVINTLLRIWPELEYLVGNDWPDLEVRLLAWLARYSVPNDETMHHDLRFEVQSLLEAYPHVITRLNEQIAASDQAERRIHNITSIHGAQGVFHGAQGVFHGAQGIFRSPIIGSNNITIQSVGSIANDTPTFTRYTDISCPRRVWVETPRISIVVRLTQQPNDYSDVTVELKDLDATVVQVRIDAPGFEQLGPAEQEVPVLPNADSPPLVFDLRPSDVGETHITFDFFQAGNPIGTASINVEITRDEVGTTQVQQAGPILRTNDAIEAPDFILYISYDRFQGQPKLTFELRPRGEIGQRFESITLESDPQAYAAQIYQRLTNLTNRIDPTTQAVLGQTRAIKPDDAESLLREEGQNLWRDLIPQTLQDIYAQERAQWHDCSLLIVSDEPFIPWELLWPYGDWDDEGPLCLTMRLSRWLRRETHQCTANNEPLGLLPLQSLVLLVPSDSKLKAAQDERHMLDTLRQQQGWHDADPTAATLPLVRNLLSHGNYDWVHVAAHGNFHPDDPDGESAIWLQDRQPLRTRTIVGSIEQRIRKQRPAFVFNACEVGRQGWSLTGIGGWANRLLSAGASLFLAPLWIASDGLAFTFSQAFYTALCNGETVAEAVRHGRRMARQAGNPTWLAYSLYAHPNARLVKPA